MVIKTELSFASILILRGFCIAYPGIRIFPFAPGVGLMIFR